MNDYKPFAILYQDNVAVIDVNIRAFAYSDYAFMHLEAATKEFQIVVLDEQTHSMLFQKIYTKLPETVRLGIASAGLYSVHCMFKNGYGFINEICKQVRIESQQANFDVAVIDQKMHAYDNLVGSTLQETGINVTIKRNKLIDIAGMHNATLYNSHEGALFKPKFNQPYFKITKYDAYNPGEWQTNGRLIDLGYEKSEILYLQRLQEGRLVDNDAIKLLQYGAHYLTLQFDLPAIEQAYGHKLFSFRFREHDLATWETLHIVYDTPHALLVELMNTCFGKSAYPIFNMFTWQLVEAYDNEDAAEDTPTSWLLYAYSKMPMSEHEFKIGHGYTGTDIDMTAEQFVGRSYSELTDNLPAIVTVVANEDSTADIDSVVIIPTEVNPDAKTIMFEYGLLKFAKTNGSTAYNFLRSNTSWDLSGIDDDTKTSTGGIAGYVISNVNFGTAGNKDLTDFVDKLNKFIEDMGWQDSMYVQVLHTNDAGLIKKVAIHAIPALHIRSSNFIGEDLYDVKRLVYNTDLMKVPQGEAVAVGSYVCCIPDECVWTFAPYDINWTVSRDGTQIHQSIRYLLKFLADVPGQYDITLTATNRLNEKAIQLRRSVIVSKP